MSEPIDKQEDAEVERLLIKAYYFERNADYQQRRAERAEGRIAELARMFGVCDGGTLLE